MGTPEPKVCLYCGLSETDSPNVNLGFGKGMCNWGYCHIFVTKEEFKVKIGKDWVEPTAILTIKGLVKIVKEET